MSCKYCKDSTHTWNLCPNKYCLVCKRTENWTNKCCGFKLLRENQKLRKENKLLFNEMKELKQFYEDRIAKLQKESKFDSFVKNGSNKFKALSINDLCKALNESGESNEFNMDKPYFQYNSCNEFSMNKPYFQR